MRLVREQNLIFTRSLTQMVEKKMLSLIWEEQMRKVDD